MRIIGTFLALFWVWASVGLTQSTSQLDETRARALGESLRCVVCQNQSIEESDSQLAGDMRKLVRQRIASGDSDGEIRAYMRVRYGDYILMRPPLQISTWVLWGGPLVFAGLFAWVFWRMTTRKGED